MARHFHEACDALRAAIGKKALSVASYIKYKKTTVQRWMLPRPSEDRGLMQNGSRSPHELVIDVYEGCREFGQSREDALAPIYWINERVDLLSFPMPRLDVCPKEIRTAFMQIAAEFGDVARVIDQALDPKGPGGGEVTMNEYRESHKQIMEAVRALLAEDELLKKAVRR